MGKLHRLRLKSEIFVVKHPKVIVPIMFVTFLLLITVLECLRARMYVSHVENYKNSSEILTVKDSINKLNRIAGRESALPAYCSLSVEGLIGNLNEAYRSDSETRESSELVRSIHQQAEEAEPSPAFNSLLQFLPRVREARDISENLNNTLEKIKNLTGEDSRSSYCLALVDVLSEVYFVNDIRTIQGVSALTVGQLDNFTINVNQAQEILLSLTPPKSLKEQHVALNEFMNDLRLDLQEDANDTELFSRNIQSNFENLESVLSTIEVVSKDLLTRPELLALYSAAFD